MLKPERVPRLLPFDCFRQLPQDAEFDALENLRDGGLTNPEIAGNLVLRPPDIGQLKGSKFTRSDAGSGFVTTLTAAATTTRGLTHRAGLAFVRVIR